MPIAPRSPLRSRLGLIVGLGVAASLVAAAFIDLGNPLEAARGRASRLLRLRAAELEAAWDTVARATAPPTGTRGAVVEGAPEDARPATIAGPTSEAGPRGPFDGLFDTGRRAAAAGDLVDAIAFAEDALRAAPDHPRAGEARLALARWWTRLGEPVPARRHREAAAAAPLDALVEGMPIALLARLVEPVDGAGALAALEEGASDALWGAGRPALVPTAAGLTLAAPPAVKAVRAALAPHLDARALDAALVGSARSRAAWRLLRARGIEPTVDRWTAHGEGDAAIAVRGSESGGVAVAALDRGALFRSLSWRAAQGALRQAVESEGSSTPPTGAPELELTLDGYGAPVTVSTDDPAIEAEDEIFQQRLFRGGLLGLALFTALAALSSAKATARAQALADQRSTFVASVSHELRTPVQAVLLLSEALDEGRVVGEAATAKYHARIRHETERMRRLVEDLLDGARIDRGDGPRLEPTSVHMESFLEGFERDARARAEQDGAHVTVVHEGLPARLEFDASAVYRAAWNLFENALRYGRRGDEPARVDVRFGTEAGALVVSVADGGPGIPDRLSETVFEPFERVRDAHEGIAGDTGTGLGLSIVRGIAEAHGGDARVQRAHPARGGGADFVVRFGPRAEEGGAA
ncbi:MAG: ATP-binding protein [Planctomycetota bacterium]